jgi:Ion channel
MTTLDLLQNLATSVVLVCISVLIQVMVTLVILKFFSRAILRVEARSSYWRQVFVLTGLILTIIADHLLQIHVWGSAFYLLSYFPDFWTSQYFAAQTYTTLGYGDLLLPPARRMISGWLALTGLLMIGWSTALFAYLLTRYHEKHLVS